MSFLSVLFIGAILAVSVYKYRKHRREQELRDQERAQIAAAAGLRYSPATLGTPASIAGELHGLPVELEWGSEGEDRGRTTRYRVGCLPPKLELKLRGFLTGVRTMLGTHALSSGDEVFDRSLFAAGTELDGAMLRDPAVQASTLRMLEAGAQISGGALTFTSPAQDHARVALSRLAGFARIAAQLMEARRNVAPFLLAEIERGVIDPRALSVLVHDFSDRAETRRACALVIENSKADPVARAIAALWTGSPPLDVTAVEALRAIAETEYAPAWLKDSARRRVAEIQAALPPGAGAGQLSLASPKDEEGALSFSQPSGRISIIDDT